jgi:hypothetical protein
MMEEEEGEELDIINIFLDIFSYIPLIKVAKYTDFYFTSKKVDQSYGYYK